MLCWHRSPHSLILHLLSAHHVPDILPDPLRYSGASKETDTWMIHPFLSHFYCCHPCLFVTHWFLTEELLFLFRLTILFSFISPVEPALLKWCYLQHYESQSHSPLCYMPQLEPDDEATRTQSWRKAAFPVVNRRNRRFVLSLVHLTFSYQYFQLSALWIL